MSMSPDPSRPILFGSDYDGTYRKSGPVPDERDLIRVADFRRRGHIFGIVTGRIPCEIEPYLSGLGGEYDFLLCATGGICILKGGETLFSESCEASALTGLFDICIAQGAGHVHTNAAVLEGGLTSVTQLPHMTPSEAEGCGHSLCNLIESSEGGIVSVFVEREQICRIREFNQFTAGFPDGESAQAAMAAIEAAYPGKFTCHFLGQGFDLTRSDISKTVGLRRLAKHLGVEESCIFTAGDNWNDLDMLQSFNGFAMESAPEGVRTKVGRVAPCVGDAIRQLLSEQAGD